MNIKTLTRKRTKELLSPKMNDEPDLSGFPSGPFSSFCKNPADLEKFLDRRILDFHKVLPKRFVRYLTSHDFPRTIKDLLEFNAEKLMKSKGIGIITVNQIIRFLNKISELSSLVDSADSPGFFIGPDIGSCFQSPEKLFAGLGRLEIRWFECFLPAKFVSYLSLHPELVTVKEILDLNTKKLLKERRVGVITLKQLLDFLNNLPDLNSRIITRPYTKVKSEAYGNIEPIVNVHEDDRFYLYDILEIHYGLISNLLRILPERDRQVLQRRFVGRNTFQEIGAELNLSRQRILLIVQHHIQILKRTLSLFEMRFKRYIVQMLYEMDGFIDNMLYPEDTGSVLYVNILSYIYPFLPTRANSLTPDMIWRNKYLSNMKHRLMEQEIGLYQYTFKSLCQFMEITDTDDAMNLYRIILCGHGVGFDVKDGIVYVVKTGPMVVY